MRVRNARDLLAGCLFLAFGVAFLVLAQNYPLGSARRMGPAYFPVVLSLILIAIGLATMTRALLVAGPPIRDFASKSLALVTGQRRAVRPHRAGGGPCGRYGCARAGLRPGQSALSAALDASVGARAGFCTLVFVTGLGLPFPALGSWLRG